MFEFIQRNWVGIVLVVGMLVMHLGGHGHGGHGGHGGRMGGCGGHAGHDHGESDAPARHQDPASPRPSNPDPTRDAYNPDDQDQAQRPDGSGPRYGSAHRPF